MKKILSLALAALMLVSAVPMVYAAENETDYTNGTAITLNGSGTEAYTVTVPATMSPGDTATVKAEGTWAADKFLAVGSPNSVTLTYGAQTMDVSIAWTHDDGTDLGRGFILIGNSVDPVSKEVKVSVEDASRLFGTWEGILEYDVQLIAKGDANRDGMITAEDGTYIQNRITQGTEIYQEFTEEELVYTDMNNDGKVSGTDAMLIQQMVEGIRVANGFWNSLNPATAATE